MSKRFDGKAFINRVEQATIVRVVRSGLTNMIPILIVGAFALILKTFPIEGYQSFIANFANGFLLELFDIVYSATFGVLSVYMTYFISRSYMKLKDDIDTVSGGAAAASLASFFILAGAYLPDFGTGSLGPKSMFLALITGLCASWLYLSLCRFFKKKNYLYTPGADRDFNRMISTLLPIAFVIIVFALLNLSVIRIFDVDSFRELIASAFNGLFSAGKTGFFKGFFFVLLSSVLWFFGIHGSDTLEGVMQTYFAPGLAQNQAALAAGAEPSVVLTKEFFDCFVLIGGCGATLCLLITILIFSKNTVRRRLGLTAAFPMIFNINELMVFGLPIILNPIMLIPFLTVPLFCYSTAYLCISTGLVPMITSEVAWTTPILLGGYTATGSIAGSLLQLFNVVCGVFIYLPFVRMLDKQFAENAKREYNSFVEFYKQNEQELSGARITDLANVYGSFARELCVELRNSLSKSVNLYYQPQYNYEGRCVGVEALLRWDHPVHGMIYPPIVIKLAAEGGFLPELEEMVMTRAIYDRRKITERFGEGVKISVNVTGATIVTQRYLQFCKKINETTPFADQDLCIEVTEQTALSFNEETRGALRTLRDMGIKLAIDDFSMGQTSLHYLKDNLFDIIKLDGSLVRGLFTHQNSREIISSIVRLSVSLELTVLAEFVETERQRDALHEIGCDFYQGYLYSPAVPLDDTEK